MDHRTRMRNDLLSVGISIAWYAVSIAANIPNADAIRASLYFLITGVVLSTGWYIVVPRRSESLTHINISKRSFLPRLAAAAFAVTVGVLWKSPALEAAIIDHRLSKSLEGEPTEEKLLDAKRIVTDAHDSGLRASPDLVSRLGAKVVSSSSAPNLREAALSTALAFANYQSSLSSPPEEKSLGPLQGNIQVGCISELTGKGSPILEGVPWFYHLDFRNCSRVSIRPLPPMNMLGDLPLDGLYARNIVFVDGTFSYDGGAITLESVQFISCRIQIMAARAGNQNVQRFLAAAVTGQPMSLSLS